jgi:predicted methyltransferase
MFFSKSSQRTYKLLPTVDWPTIVIGSVPMHRISRMSPRQDSFKKIALLKPQGLVLDTCMGLGYTAILAALQSKRVYTFEIDKDVYFMAKRNPLSRDLFKRSNIEIKQKDISQYIKKFDDNFFDCIIHDPPTFKISPLLYSVSFYEQLYRVLKRAGKMFHYTPFYGIRRGIDFPSRIKAKLKEAKFRISCFKPEQGGIICQK